VATSGQFEALEEHGLIPMGVVTLAGARLHARVRTDWENMVRPGARAGRDTIHGARRWTSEHMA